MTRKTWHQIHKWISIGVGIFLLTWIVSGVIMVLPERWFQPLQLAPVGAIDYTSAHISPQDAILRLEQTSGEKINVSWIGFTTLAGRLAYNIYSTNGSNALVDSTTDELIRIDAEMAEQIARQGLGVGPDISGVVEKLDTHDFIYPFGPLPVYRVVFGSESTNIVYVSATDGSISLSSRGTRLRAAIASLHTFEPLMFITSSERAKKGLLVFLGLVGIGTAVTGYILAILPLLSRRMRKPAPISGD